MSRGRLVVALAALLAVAGCGGAEQRPGTGKVGEQAPAYAARTMAGDSVSLQGLRGTPVLLNVWATWCHPCREEIPALQRLHEAYAERGLRVVGVSVDTEDAAQEVRDFARSFGVTYDVWLDPAERVTSTFHTIGVPTTFLIDRQGQIVWKHMGPVKDTDPKLKQALEAAL